MDKRIISIFLSLCILLSIIPVMAQTEDEAYVVDKIHSSGGSASNENGGTIILSNTDGRAGDVVEITLNINDNSGFSNLGLEINYDNSALTLLSVKENEDTGAIFTPAESISKNPYNVAWDSASNIYFNGRLATFTFKIADNAPVGEYPVEISYYKGRNGNYTNGEDVNYNENDSPLNLRYESGYINVLYDTIIRPDATAENSYNGNVYMILKRAVSWSDASKQCEEAGGHLATISSAKENSFIQSLCSEEDCNQYYLGASDSLNNGIWSWVGGESFVYTNWADGEPKKSDEGHSYLAMDCESGKWIVTNGEALLQTWFVCEWEGDGTGADSTYWVEFDLRKSVYAIGEAFEADVWLYSGDSVMRIYDNDYTVSGFDSSRPGIYNVTVSYGEYSQSFEIEVTEDKESEPIITHVVYSEARNGATISPSGYSEVTDETVMKFVVGVRDGYIIDSVTVNGETIRITDSNLTVSVDQNTVIEVCGKKKTYSIEATSSGNGYIELQSDTVEHGNGCTARIVADNGYIVSDVKVDGVSVGACKLYTFSDVKANHTIEAEFEEIIHTYTLRASAGTGGKVYPAKITVNSGGSAKLSATPDYGYHIRYALINDKMVNVSSNDIYIANITEETDVSVVFEKNTYTLSATATEGAQITFEYDGQSTQKCDAEYMSDVLVAIDVENDYKLNTLYVNNKPVKPTKSGSRLVYNISVTENIVVSARCALTLVSEFSKKVSTLGTAADINASNAYSKKKEFTNLSNEYAKLSEDEKSICTSAYATLLSALDRANAYIALIESQITERISQLPSSDELDSGNYRNWQKTIDTVYAEYENMTYLSKSLIDIEFVKKLSLLKTKAEEFDKESKGAVLYLCELIDSVPDIEGDVSENLPAVYAKLLLSENTYNNMSEQDKGDVPEEKYNALIAKHGKISTYIQKLYVTPFTSRVLRSSAVVTSDSVEDAESKRALIYELMNEYHSFPAFVQEHISSSTIQKLNALYESASIKVSATVNNLPVDMNGDFSEDVELVITEPELDNTSVTDATGKSLYQAIDVKMYSEDQEIQPSSKIRVKMEISKELSDADVSVVYINDNDEVYDVQGEVIEEYGKYYIVFFVDHFSNFAVLYNETNAPDTSVTFDVEYAEEGDYITATVNGLLNSAECTLYVAGYSKTGELTFLETGSTVVSVVIAENTATVKAMIWDKSMMPVINPVLLYVAGNERPEPEQTIVSFNTTSAKTGDYITATVSGPDADECTLYMAGYSKNGVLTFVETGKSASVSATIAENTAIVKAMLWDKSMSPVIKPVILYVEESKEPEKNIINFNKQYAHAGDYITAVSSGPNAADCILYMAGYSESGVLTFVERKNTESISATIPQNTKYVKAMMWTCNLTPLAEAKVLSVYQ